MSLSVKEQEPKGIGADIFQYKYAYPGETTWKQRAKAISKAIAVAEPDDKKALVEQQIYDAVRSMDLLPGGRIVFGSGRSNYNLLNCYVLNPDDSVESIAKTVSDMYKISCAGGGVGFNFSNIRPKGDDIQNISNSAPGAVSVMKMINEIGDHVRAGKNRRTALIGILDVTHPDLNEFLSVKLDSQQLNNFNISVGITDRFIDAVKADDEWYYTFNNKKYYSYNVEFTNTTSKEVYNLKVVGLNEDDASQRALNFHARPPADEITSIEKEEIKATSIWDYIWKNSVESGDPGIFNVSLTNKKTNVSYFEDLQATNPCGEIPLPSYGNCCLGHVNLANMVDSNGDVDYKRIARTVRVGVRFLDNVLTVNTFPIPECREVGHRSRRIGLGVTGLHYLLIKAGYRYGSNKSLLFIEDLFRRIRDEAYKASVNLAKEKGAFPAFDANLYLKEDFAKSLPTRIKTNIRKFGIRNAVMLTVAPVGTMSMVAGVSTGIEPIFAPMYKRRYRHGTSWKEEIMLDPLFEKYYLEGKDVSHFVGAYDVTPEEHLSVQASIQEYVDSALSKTCNVPNDCTYEDLKDTILSYAEHVKGFTIYRAGSKGNEPLEAVDISNKETLDAHMLNYKRVEITDEERELMDVNCKSGVCEL